MTSSVPPAPVRDRLLRRKRVSPRSSRAPSPPARFRGSCPRRRARRRCSTRRRDGARLSLGSRTSTSTSAVEGDAVALARALAETSKAACVRTRSSAQPWSSTATASGSTWSPRGPSSMTRPRPPDGRARDDPRGSLPARFHHQCDGRVPEARTSAAGRSFDGRRDLAAERIRVLHNLSFIEIRRGSSVPSATRTGTASAWTSTP